ncbi:MAG TPA: 3'-5' exonuclease, partial [bacterium]|nr:3'-5' exonuclease [bacterium]
VDYDDLIALPVRLLRFDPELRRRQLEQNRVIAVDEFQDIDAAQYELFRIFALHADDICVIGDPDQSIYGFRGASPEFFLRLQEELPGARLLRLRQNYRSSRTILTASTGMLRRGAPKQGEETVAARTGKELKIQFHAAASDAAEAVFVAQQIEALIGGASHFALDADRADGERSHTYGFGDFAVLLRSRLLAGPLEEVLANSGLPFRRIADQYEKDRDDLTRPAGVSGQDESDEPSLPLDPRGDRIQILTLHAAKGLEFPVIFIIGCEEEILPFAFGGSSDVEEERRLFYVGMTRARERLYLTHARTRMLRGQRRQQSPSRFLADISRRLLKQHTAPQLRRKDKDQLKLF